MLSLTGHFKDNWRERVGGEPPEPHAVEAIIMESIYLQPCFRYIRLEDGKIDKTLAIYWHPGRNLVIKVDRYKKTAVTVLSPKVRPNNVILEIPEWLAREKGLI